MPDPLIHQLAHHEYLRAQLIERFPDVGEETLNDTLEGLTNLHEMLAVVIRSHLEDRVLSEALRVRIEEMRERLNRLEHKVEKKRDLVATVMERAQIRKIVEPDFTASMREGLRLKAGRLRGSSWTPQENPSANIRILLPIALPSAKN